MAEKESLSAQAMSAEEKAGQLAKQLKKQDKQIARGQYLTIFLLLLFKKRERSLGRTVKRNRVKNAFRKSNDRRGS